MADKKKKSAGRRGYLDDFQRTVDGEFVYTGKEHRWSASRKKLLLETGLPAVLAAAGTVINGCLAGTGMERHFYTILPYVVQLLAWVLVLVALIRLAAAKETIRDYIYKKTVLALPGRTAAAGSAAIVTILAEIAMLLLTETEARAAMAAVFLGLELVSLLAALWIWKKIPELKANITD